MKLYGLPTIIIGTIGIALCYLLLCYPFANPQNAEWFGSTGKSIILFYSVYGVVFFKIIYVGDRYVKVFRPLWFLYKENKVRIEAIRKVIITKNNLPTGGAVEIDIYRDKYDGVFSVVTQMRKFELRQLAGQIRKRGIQVDLEGLAFYDN